MEGEGLTSTLGSWEQLVVGTFGGGEVTTGMTGTGTLGSREVTTGLTGTGTLGSGEGLMGLTGTGTLVCLGATGVMVV